MGVVVALGLIVPLLLGAVLPGEYGRLLSAAKRSYAAGRYQEAGQRFEAALKAKPGDPLAQMGRGCAWYRLQKWAEAETDFSTVAQGQDVELQEDAEYNAGNCLFRQGQYADAIERYRRALILNPGDQDAKFNLELALKRQEESKPPPRESPKQREPSPQRRPQPQEQQKQGQQPQGNPDRREGEPSSSSGRDKQQTGSGEMSRSQAEQLLNALAADESNLRRLMPRAPVTGEPKPTDKTW